MPEFILDRGDIDTACRFDKLDLFTQSYIEAAFFADDPGRSDPRRASSDGADDGEPCTLADLSEQAWAELQRDAAAFVAKASAALGDQWADLDSVQAGHDFWLTRNRHGVGFWGRDDDTYGDAATRDTLDEIAKSFAECNLYLGDDGKIYAT